MGCVRSFKNGTFSSCTTKWLYKISLFLCLWDSRANNEHLTKKNWPTRVKEVIGKNNIINRPLITKEKIFLPPLHIKLGLMKQFVKALNNEGTCFNYLTIKFPRLSKEKISAGIFDGPQIREFISDENFIKDMNSVEMAAWTSFVQVQNMLSSFRKLGCSMSIKVHYLESHLDYFPANLGDVSEEQGERFHQDIKTMENRYQGRWDTHMMADYCWSLRKDGSSSNESSRKSLKRSFSTHEMFFSIHCKNFILHG